MRGDDNGRAVDLTFTLGSTSSSATTRTVLVNPYPDDDAGQVNTSQGVSRGVLRWQETTDAGRERAMSTMPSAQEMRRQREDSIMQGVQRLSVGGRGAGETGVGGGVALADDGEGDWSQPEENTEAFPMRPPNMDRRGGRRRTAMAPDHRRRKGVAGVANGDGDVDGDGGRNFWSVDHMITFMRAKRDQDAQLQASGRAYARMRTREWKWADVWERLLKVGVDQSADKCGKKWDNLMQQFKKVHNFMRESGKEDFLFTKEQRAEKGFNFTMERAVYDEIKGATEKRHTINPTNVANTGIVPALPGVCIFRRRRPQHQSL
ncbi:hypothetical protein CBR_g3720 [Chara braunii]|uniref:Myb/SANT-like DNA-binding domain-containing protein n=1 Tax=Chara braunii TaxID=69332 RepID=A0A388KG25_CHABU|nr:hypothetical protein CBR_g3720 [Chara braunii]|eukprot:GBG69020.1 hypothetical protein CBR_g3720 [Chara braunii]